MVTFSVIVPVYNVEKYISKCLDSILGQSCDDFEIIVVNDGSPDNSQSVIDNYVEKYPLKIKSYIKENGGLSDARNYGIDRASGEYMLFIDSDDYISPDLLSELKNTIETEKSDVIRFAAQIVYETGETGEILKCDYFKTCSGEDATEKFINNKQYYEPACFYAYRRQFWLDNQFQFSKGKYHEDFGLIPEVIFKADRVSIIDLLGYFYVQSASSITRESNEEKDVKRAYDCLAHFDRLKLASDESFKNPTIKKKFDSYLANSIIAIIGNLNGEHRQRYILEVKKRKIFDLLLCDNLKRYIKKVLLKLKYSRYN